MVEAVIVSVNFGDLLAETLPVNRPQFDRVVAVTVAEDDETQAVAEANDAVVVLSARHRDGGPFNKAAMINDGLGACGADWLCHLDADIALPPQMIAGAVALAESLTVPRELVIWGAQRLMVHGKPAWDWYRRTGSHGWQFDKWRHRRNPPPGFFQLWHRSAGHRYPEQGGTAGGTDLAFAEQFDRWAYLPYMVFHLATHNINALDHTGRVSPRWGA